MEPMKILLVDDSKSARYALRLQLQRHGVEVDTADSAESAFEHLKNTLPDAIMMDHMMPGLNGFEALEVIRKDPKTAHLPVVMCTSHEDPSFAIAAKEKGAIGILPKSTAPDKLPAVLELLQEALSEQGAAEEAPAPAAAPPPAPRPEAITEARALELVDTRMETQLDARIEERFESRVGGLLTPMLDELRRELTERMSAETADMLSKGIAELSHAQSAERPAVEADDIRAAAEEFISERLPKVVGAEIQSTVNQLVESTLPDLVKGEIEAAIDHLVKRTLPELVRAEIDEITDAIARQTLPELVKIEIEAERGQVMELVEQYLGELRPQLGQRPAIPDDLLEEIEKKITGRVQELAIRESQSGIETAIERAKAAAEEAAGKVKPALGGLYAAVAGAGAIGVAAAALVFFLLR